MFIIGLGHQKHVGKDLMAKILMGNLRLTTNLNIQKKSFAFDLKNICYELYSWGGLKDACYYDNHPDEKEIILPELQSSPRIIWIEIANKIRAFKSDTWLDLVVKKISCDILIISDLRYVNEANKIKEQGGLCIKIERDLEIINKNRSKPITHNDEADINLNGFCSWDYIIENNGTINEFCAKIKTIESLIKNKTFQFNFNKRI